MVKVTVLYGHPTDPTAFEKYYLETHMPIAQRMQGIARAELTRFTAAPDGGRPAFYRMAEFWFDSPAQMQTTMASAAAQAAVADIANFATGGVTILMGTV